MHMQILIMRVVARFTNMRTLEIQKPVIGKQTQLSQAFEEFMKDLPINSWCLKNKK